MRRRRPEAHDAHWGKDPVLALYKNYFAAARRLYEEVIAAEEQAEISLGEAREAAIYRLETFLPLWFSALFTCCEVFQKVEERTLKLLR